MADILVTGCNGQLGSELQALSGHNRDHHFLFTDLEELDISDPDSLERYLDDNRVDAVINCAAYTAVDKAESEPGKAMAINGEAPGLLAASCKKRNIYLVHISTDYIFDGTSSVPYREEDPPNPLSLYGKSKLAGEKAMISQHPDGMIIRTAWLYSSFGHNFVKTILRKAREEGRLRVVNDQSGSPTYARDLAGAILEIMPKAMEMNGTRIFHYANQGHCSWFELAQAITAITDIPCRIDPISTAALKLAAPRPANSILDTEKIRKTFGIGIPQWQDSLRDCLDLLEKNNG